MESEKKSYSVYQTEKKNWIHIEIPNIVEEELFDIVQEQLSENRKEQECNEVEEGTYYKG